MTDSSGPLGDARVVLAGLLAVLTAAVVALVVGRDPATAATYLLEPVNAAVVLADGRTETATEGMVVPCIAVVRTATCLPGPCGGGRLTTAGRDVYLGAETAVRVLDGVRQQLQLGQVMVDNRHGAGLALGTRAGLLQVDADALARVELGPVLRLGVFAGNARITAAGRQATTPVSELYQVQVPYVGLAGAPTALALLDDDWEQRLAGALVNADRDLISLEHGLDGPNGAVVLSGVALRPVVPVDPAQRGEEALARALAQAAQRSSSLDANFATVQTARQQGGSWGVVAAIAQARVSTVSALLDHLLGASNPTISALPTPGLTDLFGPHSTPVPGGPSHRPPTPSPTRSPTPGPTPPTHSPSVVDQVVATVNSLLPTPAPSAAPTPSPLLPLPLVSRLLKLP